LVTVGGQQLVLASYGKRFGAAIVDGLIFGAAFYALGIALFIGSAVATADEIEPGEGLAVSTEAWMTLAFITSLATMGVWWLFDTLGWSPGKAATGIRAVRLDGRRPGVVHGLVRYSMRVPSALTFGLGYLWPLWDERDQGWHDKLADTVVVRGAGPLDERIAERRPEPLVTRPRVWWLAGLATAILTASVALNVWWASNFDTQLFEDPYYEPYRRDDSPRIFAPIEAGPATTEVVAARR